MEDGRKADGGARAADLEAAQRRVREHFVEPLIAMGMQRPARRRRDEHEEWLARLVRRLAYLGADELAVLRDVVQRLAVGRSRDVWPSECAIINHAALIAPPPGRDSRLVVSWMASAAGARAMAEGIEVAVALRRFLRRHGRPPTEFDWSQIRADAEMWRRDRARHKAAEDDGTIGEAGRRWLSEWHRAAERVRALVAGDIVAEEDP